MFLKLIVFINTKKYSLISPEYPKEYNYYRLDKYK